MTICGIRSGRKEHESRHSEERGKKLPSVHLIAIHILLTDIVPLLSDLHEAPPPHLPLAKAYICLFISLEPPVFRSIQLIASFRNSKEAIAKRGEFILSLLKGRAGAILYKGRRVRERKP